MEPRVAFQAERAGDAAVRRAAVGPATVESYHGRHTRGRNDVAAARRRAQVGPEPVEPLYYTVLLGGRRHAPTTAALVDATTVSRDNGHAQA